MELLDDANLAKGGPNLDDANRDYQGEPDRMAYSPAELARLMGLSRRAIYRAVDRGELPASRVANRLRIRVQDIERWLEAGRVRSRSAEPSSRRFTCRETNQGPLGTVFSGAAAARGVDEPSP